MDKFASFVLEKFVVKENLPKELVEVYEKLVLQTNPFCEAFENLIAEQVSFFSMNSED
jgi:hypothetical protein